jgi:DNA-binding XRE family transcriptional regulator
VFQNATLKILKKMAFKVKMPQNSFKKDLFLTEIRKKLGITQVQLAAMLKVSRSYVSLVELKKRQGQKLIMAFQLQVGRSVSVG